MDQCPLTRKQRRTVKGRKMRAPAAILLTMMIATPAMAVDVVSGSGEVVTNGAGMTMVNGDPCDGRMEAACLDRQSDRVADRTDEFEDLGPTDEE